MLAAGILALTCIGVLFNIWFIQNTNTIIESLVSARSNGRIHLQLSKSSFQYFKKKIILRDATFYSIDTSGAKTNYQFTIPALDLKIRSFWSFLAYRELLIDSITLRAPVVTVTRLSKAVKQDKTTVSIPEEIGRVYNSILDALQVLQVKRFQIDEGRFHLVNKIDPQQPITTISNIHFHINNLNINSDSTTAKFLFSDNIVLRVTNQDIILPDGIHHISFKNLLINVRSKQVQLDSCWVRAETKGDRNAFRIFFDVLKMANLDFTALYKKNLIKADSVYINNPDINLALDIKRKREKSKKLELDTIIQQFTGDLALGYIGVQNAAVNIIANRGDTTTTFSSKNDNFKMYGLRVNSDSAKPVYVDEFTMILRKYETYSRDSSALYRFDSLRFTNNKVRLSNFTIQSIANNPTKGSLYYAIPTFELSGLSWEELLFDRYISAQKAVLLNPTIQYSVAASRKRPGKSSVFKVLSGLNEAINLEAVEIRNGDLNIQLPAGRRLTLQHVDVVLASNKLLASKSYTGMKQAVNELTFRNAVFSTGNLRAELINLYYSDRLYADELRVTNKSKTLTALAKGITLDDLIWNKEEKSVFVDHLTWRQAAITLKTGSRKSPQKASTALIELSNLHGKNTAFTIYAKDKLIKTQVDNLALQKLVKKGTADATLVGLTATGKTAEVKAPNFGLNAGVYSVVDGGTSSIRAISFLQQSAKDSIQLFFPQTFFKPHIQDWVKGNFRFDKLTASAPVFNFTSNAQAKAIETTTASNIRLPRLSIAELAITAPTVHYVKHDSVRTTLTWQGSDQDNNNWTFYAIRTTPQQNRITAEKADFNGTDFIFIRNEKPFGIDSGRVRLQFKDIAVAKGHTLQWSAHLQNALFKNPISLSLKNQSGIFADEAQVRNVTLSSDNLKSVYQLLQRNPAMLVKLTNGSFAAAKLRFHWKNVSYDQSSRSASVDSFAYQPALSRDSAIAAAPGQTDYIYGVLKNMTITDIDLTALERDSIFAARSVVVDRATLNIYRDKRKPFLSGGLKPLPVIALQNLPVKLAVDTVALKNANVAYTEMSERTNQEATITINRIDAQLFPVRNVDVGTHDSLALHAEGYLMDSAWLRLRLKQSYTDSLGTFAMTLRVKPTGLSFLNPVLMPLASVKLVSGTLDTITMRAVGHEYFSIGTMQMFYKDLKIQFLKKGSETKKTFLTGLITFAANNFVIKRNNNRKTGTVYFLRNRDRSIFNFLIKTALSGIASSIGAKKNKTYYRQYKRQQKLYKLPPSDFS